MDDIISTLRSLFVAYKPDTYRWFVLTLAGLFVIAEVIEGWLNRSRASTESLQDIAYVHLDAWGRWRIQCDLWRKGCMDAIQQSERSYAQGAIYLLLIALAVCAMLGVLSVKSGAALVALWGGVRVVILLQKMKRVEVCWKTYFSHLTGKPTRPPSFYPILLPPAPAETWDEG